MPTTNVPHLPTLVVGDQTRRLVIAETILVDTTPGSETVRIAADGPDGPAVLTGRLVDVLAAVWQLDVRLNRLARGDF